MPLTQGFVTASQGYLSAIEAGIAEIFELKAEMAAIITAAPALSQSDQATLMARWVTSFNAAYDQFTAIKNAIGG